MTRHFCDMCGNELVGNTVSYSRAVPGHMGSVTIFDLCTACDERLSKILNEKRKQDRDFPILHPDHP